MLHNKPMGKVGGQRSIQRHRIRLHGNEELQLQSHSIIMRFELCLSIPSRQRHDVPSAMALNESNGSTRSACTWRNPYLTMQFYSLASPGSLPAMKWFIFHYPCLKSGRLTQYSRPYSRCSRKSLNEFVRTYSSTW